MAYIEVMRKGSTLTVFLSTFAVAFCALLLVVALIAIGVQLVAVLALFVAIGVLTFLAFLDRTPAPAFARRLPRPRSTRAPPRF